MCWCWTLTWRKAAPRPWRWRSTRPRNSRTCPSCCSTTPASWRPGRGSRNRWPTRWTSPWSPRRPAAAWPCWPGWPICRSSSRRDRVVQRLFFSVSSAALCVLCVPLFVTTGLFAAPVQGRITDGQRGLAGVRVYPDRLPRVSPAGDVPVAVTDADGRFRLELGPDDTVLAVEKDGWRRALVPAAEWTQEIKIRAA